MDEDVRAFGETLGRTALDRDWAGVRAMLAPWLQKKMTEEQVRLFFVNQYRSTLEENDIEHLQYPANQRPRVGGDADMTAASLRELIASANKKRRPLAPQVTDDNIRFWMKLELQSSHEQADELGFDCFSETWMAIVETDGGLRVGYWSQGAY